MQWNDQYIKKIERTVGQRVQSAGYYLVGKTREKISVPGRTFVASTTKSGKKRVVRGKLGSNPSKPGEAPHKQTGRLRVSVATEYDPDTLTARVGTNVKHGKFLELGTSRMAARPWLRPSLSENKRDIVKIIAGSTND